MTSILEHTRVVIQKGTSVHVFDLSTKWQVILFYDLTKIFIINSIYKYCIWTYSTSFLKIHLWLLCYNWWASRIRTWIWFVGWFRIISAILNRVANLTENFGASGIFSGQPATSGFATLILNSLLRGISNVFCKSCFFHNSLWNDTTAPTAN